VLIGCIGKVAPPPLKLRRQLQAIDGCLPALGTEEFRQAYVSSNDEHHNILQLTKILSGLKQAGQVRLFHVHIAPDLYRDASLRIGSTRAYHLLHFRLLAKHANGVEPCPGPESMKMIEFTLTID